MPADFGTNHSLPPIQVRDRVGTGLPFSKGLLSASILATGLETERAYTVAAEIERQLRLEQCGEISVDELAERAADVIHRHAGREVANRYRAWRNAKRSGRPVVLALGGVPGVGKSTLATRLAVRLGIAHIATTDTIREVLRTVIPETVLAELHASSYETIAEIFPGEMRVGSFHRQSRAVGAAAVAVATRLVKERRSVVLEGVHLVPGKLRSAFERHSSKPIVVEVLLVLDDEQLHRAFLTHRLNGEPARGGQRHLDHFATIRQLQTTLREIAQSAGIIEHDVSRPGHLTQRIVDEIVVQGRSEVERQRTI